MIQDSTFQFCTNLALTSGNVQLTNSYPLAIGTLMHSPGSVSALYVEITVTAAFTGTGSVIFHNWIAGGGDVWDYAGTTQFLGSTQSHSTASGNALGVQMLGLGDRITVPIMPLSSGNLKWIRGVEAALAGAGGAVWNLGVVAAITGTFASGTISACLTSTPTTLLQASDLADAVN